MPSFAFGAGAASTVEEEEGSDDSDTDYLMRDLEHTMDVEVLPEEPVQQNGGTA
jgi:hypothetical protein